MRESLRGLSGIRKDDYSGLPDELREFNYWVPDCGRNIMAIPECLIDDALKSGNMMNFEVPMAVKYVLEKGYRFVSGHVVVEAIYELPLGLQIPDGYEEW